MHRNLPDYARQRASSFVKALGEPSGPIVALARVSGWDQGRNYNQAAQRVFLNEASPHVIRTLEYVWSGHGPGWEEQLADASQIAKSLGASLLAATTDRFLRHPLFRANDKRLCALQPTPQQFQRFQQILDGTPAYTLFDPDATNAQSKALLTTWGRRLKRRIRDRARELHRGGVSVRDVAEILSGWVGYRVNHMRVYRWVRTPP